MPPVDQLGTAEVEEGQETAFGLRLPRRFRVVKREQYSVIAEGPLGRDAIIDYVKSRVTGRHGVGPDKAIFTQVDVSSPTEPFRGSLTIEITGTDSFSRLRITGEPIIEDHPRHSHS